MNKLLSPHPPRVPASLTTIFPVSLDRMLGHKEGRMDVRDIAITAEEGAASYVQAAFAPELKGD